MRPRPSYEPESGEWCYRCEGSGVIIESHGCFGPSYDYPCDRCDGKGFLPAPYMTQEEAMEILTNEGTILQGHFVLQSGKHAPVYKNKRLLYLNPQKVSELCFELARTFLDDEIEAVVAPAIGGIPLSQSVAFHLRHLTGRKVLALFAEKQGKEFVFTCGYDKHVAGKKVLLVDDVASTGDTDSRLASAVVKAGGKVVGVGVLVCHHSVTLTEVCGVPKSRALVTTTFPIYEANACPLCADGVPINTEVGYGSKTSPCDKSS